MRRRNLAPAALLLAGAIVAAAVVASGGHASKRRPPATPAASWQGPSAPRAPRSRRPADDRRDAGAVPRPARPGRGRHRERRAGTPLDGSGVSAQQDVLLQLDTKGIFIKPELRFTRVLDGFSANLEASTVPVLERMPQIAGVYRVRAAYPATVTSTPLRGGRRRGRGSGRSAHRSSGSTAAASSSACWTRASTPAPPTCTAMC